MGPRKRSKPNPKAETESVPEEEPPRQGPEAQTQDSLKTANGESSPPDDVESVKTVSSSVNGTSSVSAEDDLHVKHDTDLQLQSGRNWYGGSWARGNKANPVTQVANESFLAAGGAASEASTSARAHPPDFPTNPLKSSALYYSKGIGGSSRSLPLAATTTKLHITSNAKNTVNGTAQYVESPKKERHPSQEQKRQNGSNTAPEAGKSEESTPKFSPKTQYTRLETKKRASDVPKATNESARWLNWFSKSEIATGGQRSMAHPDDEAGGANMDRPQDTVREALQEAPTSTRQRRNSEPSPVSPSVLREEVPRSWLSLWGNGPIQTKSNSSASATDVASILINEPNAAEPQITKLIDAELSPVSTPQSRQRPADNTRSSYGWAFWSRDLPKSDDEKTRPRDKVGELTVAGSSSQSKPENAVVDEVRSLPNKLGKRQRPQPLDASEDPQKPGSASKNARIDYKDEVVPLAPKFKPGIGASPKEKRVPENLLLPSFRATYNQVERPSLLQQIGRLLQISSASEPKHVDIVQNPPCIKRALAIVSLH